MQLTQLALQEQHQTLPTQLDFLKILDLRGTAYFKEEKKLYKSLEAGHKGEQKVIHYILEYGLPHWTVLQNVWMQDFNRFECDLILITDHTIYVFEIKNYKGTFRYDNGKCFYDSIETSLNPIEQLRGNLVNLKRICAKVSPHIDVQAAVVFAGEDHEIQVESAPEDIQIITSNGIRNFILKMANEEKMAQGSPVDTNKILQAFNRYEIPHPFQPAPLTSDEMKEIKPGICCANCHSFDVKITKFKVICPCGLTESREEAIVRTICDYGVLNYTSHLTRRELLTFFANQVTRYLLTETIYKHFTIIENGRYTLYVNMKLPYEKIRHLFEISQPKIFHHKSGMLSYF